MLISNKFGGNSFVAEMIKAHTFDALLKSSFMMIAVKDLKGNHVFASDMHLKTFGFASIDDLNNRELNIGWTGLYDEWEKNDLMVAQTGVEHPVFERVVMKPREPMCDKSNPAIKFFAIKYPIWNLLKTKISYVGFTGLTTGEKFGGIST